MLIHRNQQLTKAMAEIGQHKFVIATRDTNKLVINMNRQQLKCLCLSKITIAIGPHAPLFHKKLFKSGNTDNSCVYKKHVLLEMTYS